MRRYLLRVVVLKVVGRFRTQDRGEYSHCEKELVENLGKSRLFVMSKVKGIEQLTSGS